MKSPRFTCFRFLACGLALIAGCQTTHVPKPTIPLAEAVKSNNIEQVRAHLCWDAPSSDRGYNLSLLPLAASFGHNEMVVMMLDHGIPVSPKLKPPRPTALHYAAARGQTSTVTLLLSRSATVDAVDEYSKTPLIWAAETGQLDCAKRLIDAGADPTHRGQFGTALDAAVKNKHDDVAEFLRRHQVK